MNIDDLILSDDWDKLSDHIINNESPDLEPDRLSVTELAVIQRKHDVIDKMIREKPSVLTVLTDNGSLLHIAAKHRYWDMLRKLLPVCTDVINSRGRFMKTFIFYVDDPDTLKWCLENYKQIDLLVLSDGMTYMSMCANMIKKKNDKYYTLCKILARYQPPFNDDDIETPPIHQMAITGFIDIIKILHKNKHKIDSQNKDGLTPFLYAVMYNHDDIVRYLIDNGADPSYCGRHNRYNPFNIAIKNRSFSVLKILLEKSRAALSKSDINMRYPIHQALLYNDIPTEYVLDVMLGSDMNKKDVFGNTALHYLLTFHDWKNFTEILKKVKLDIFKNDSKGRKPIDMIKKDDLLPFMDVIASSYIHIMKELKQCKKKIDDECKIALKGRILAMKKSIPSSNDIIRLRHPKTIKTNMANFSADIIHTILYMMILLSRYSNLAVPYQFDYEFKDGDILEFHIANWPYDMDHTFYIYQKVYCDNIFEMLPALVLWDGVRFYMHPDLNMYMNVCLYSDKVRYIMMDLALIGTPSHANMLFFDKETCTIERFDPFGEGSIIKSHDLDICLRKNLVPILESYGNKIGKKIRYNAPSDYMGNGPQLFSQDWSFDMKNRGDPGGYCLAWVMWFVEMRITNPDQSSKEIIDKTIAHISRNGTGPERFIDYIRDYAHKLDVDKNNVLNNMGIPKSDWYNNMLLYKHRPKIENYLRVTFSKLMSDRR